MRVDTTRVASVRLPPSFSLCKISRDLKVINLIELRKEKSKINKTKTKGPQACAHSRTKRRKTFIVRIDRRENENNFSTLCCGRRFVDVFVIIYERVKCVKYISYNDGRTNGLLEEDGWVAKGFPGHDCYTLYSNNNLSVMYILLRTKNTSGQY